MYFKYSCIKRLHPCITNSKSKKLVLKKEKKKNDLSSKSTFKKTKKYNGASWELNPGPLACFAFPLLTDNCPKRESYH